MTPAEMKDRTRACALRWVKFAATFPKGRVGDVIGRQLVKSGTSVAANYRSACGARSHADFVNKLGIVEEETDEAVLRVELAPDAGLVGSPRVADLAAEGRQIPAIVIASQKTAKTRRQGARKRRL